MPTATAHPNKTKMDAAVARWIEEAAGRSDGATALRKRSTWMGHQIRMLGDRLIRTPDYLEGLTVQELLEAQGLLQRAARQHGKAVVSQKRAA
jgi:predicted ATP-dependent protease